MQIMRGYQEMEKSVSSNPIIEEDYGIGNHSSNVLSAWNTIPQAYILWILSDPVGQCSNCIRI